MNYKQKSFCEDSPGQHISWKIYFQQSKEIILNWKAAENFDNCFCVIFGCYY